MKYGTRGTRITLLVVVSIKIVGYQIEHTCDKRTTRMGFEPTRAEHNGLAVHHLNHSVTSSGDSCGAVRHPSLIVSVGLDRDLNPGPLAP